MSTCSRTPSFEEAAAGLAEAMVLEAKAEALQKQGMAEAKVKQEKMHAEAIGKEEIISAEVCDEMMDILFDQNFNDVIPVLLPEDVKVAHKTGSITGVQHDSGIIVLPNGHKYVLILLSKNLEDRKQGIDILSRVSEMVYKFVVAEKDEY